MKKNRTLQEKINLLSNYQITLIRWKDNYKHWRLGLDWKDENDYEFICEQPTVHQCLDLAIEYVRTHYPKELFLE